VQDSYNEAVTAGGNGTPYILITQQGSKDAVPLEGAQPYDSMIAAIDAVLKGIPGATTTTAPAATSSGQVASTTPAY
jgi:predicted DsbA family dithiol-disulfide isomerase